ncbi:MAG: fibronectin type III domain-containing protein [Bacteroidales bacterium]|nr:fibronectin type III domain-containing protein [Bacteroidales bacterium]
MFGNGEKPAASTSFRVERQADARNADISWEPVQDAMEYVLYWGIEPDKLNNSVMIYDASAYELRALNRGVDYFFAIEAFNENGISDLVSF